LAWYIQILSKWGVEAIGRHSEVDWERDEKGEECGEDGLGMNYLYHRYGYIVSGKLVIID
jgi:hypothetical protein